MGWNLYKGSPEVCDYLQWTERSTSCKKLKDITLRMQTSLGHQRSLPASTSGRCSNAASDCAETCSRSAGRLLGRLARSRTLLLGRGSSLKGSGNHRGGLLPACCLPGASEHVRKLRTRSSSAAKRDVRAQVGSTAGQVGVAAVEVVDAPHPELLSFSSLPGSYSSPRDSYLNIQNVESLTRELAEVGEDLERLAVSEVSVQLLPISCGFSHVFQD